MPKGGFLNIGLILLSILVGGCASTPEEYSDPRDPWKSYNRKVYGFNQAIDKAVLKPVAKGYKAITPEPVDHGITNFFDNLADVNSAVNNLLQFKLSRTGSDVGRVVMNTTVGLFGLFDVATNMGFPSYKEDFGQTFGYWGDEPSPYIVLPFLGPSTMRDSIGLWGDMFVNPFAYLDDLYVYSGLTVLNFVDTRSDLLTAGELLEEAAFDPYVFTRDAYLQRRRDKIFDGSPPQDEEEDFWTDEEGATAADDPAVGSEPSATMRVSLSR